MQITEALKSLYKKVTGKTDAPQTDQIAELINQLAEDWPESSVSDQAEQGENK